MNRALPHIILLVPILLSWTNLQAQDEGLDLKAQGKSYENNRQFAEAIESYEKAIPFLQVKKDLLPYYETIRDLSYCYLDVNAYEKASTSIVGGIAHYEARFQDSFLVIYPKMIHCKGQVHLDQNEYKKARRANRKALFHYQKLEDEKERKKYTSFMYNNIGAAYSNERLIDSALFFYEKSLPLKLEVLGPSSRSTLSTLRNISRIYQNWGQLDKAIETVTVALNAALEVGDKVGEAKAYDGLSQMYQRKYDFETSKAYISKTFEIYKALGPSYREDMAFTYHQMGNVLETQRKHKESVEWYWKAKNEKRDFYKGPSYSEGLTTMNLGKAFNYMAEQKKEDPSFDYEGMSVEELRAQSIAYFEENERIFESTIPNDHVRYIELWLSKGVCYLEGGDSLKAHQLFLKAYQLAYKKTPEKSYDRSLSCLNLSRTHSDIDSAIYLCQQGLWELSKGWEYDGPEGNPSPKEVFYDHWSLILLEHKSTRLFDKYLIDNNYEALKTGISAVKSGDDLIQDSRTALLTSSAKMDLAEIGYDLYAQGLNMLFELKDQNLHGDVFDFMEKSKSLLLLEELQKGRHVQGLLLPDSTLSKIERLNERINRIKIEQDKVANSDSIAIYGTQLFELNKELNALEEAIEKAYPVIKKSRDFSKIPNLKEVQKGLQADEVIYEYVETSEEVYILRIKQKDSQFFKVARSTYKDALDSLIALINDPKIALEKSNSKEVWKAFTRLSHHLYKKLLPGHSNENLIIIPDGQLHYLPFDVLLVKAVEEEVINYSQLPYLIKTSIIRYGFSTSILLSEAPAQKQSKNLLAFAPNYSASTSGDSLSRQGFGNLKYAIQEVERISMLFQSKKYVNEEAKESTFKRLAREHNYLHLAMHAYIDAANPMLSGMVFSDTEKDNILHAYEIYAMDIPSELVVLSACNTNIGQFREGEGVLSLARAFKYAGVQDIVTTMWQADDEATQAIMTQFYQGLNKGVCKAKALQEAKINYLNNSDHAFPHYWAASVLLDGQLQADKGNSYLYLVFLMILGLMILFFLNRKFQWV